MSRHVTNHAAMAAAASLVAALLPGPAALIAQEQFDLGGPAVAVYNLAGTVEVYDATGDDVVVTVDRRGPDAGELDVQVGELDGRNTLRVVYPADRVVYADHRGGGSATLRVRPDGTWGGDSDWLGRGDRVRVSGGGRGLRGHADLRIGVPAGRDVAVYLAVGEIVARNVNGEIRLDTRVGSVDAAGMSGRLTVDTGSGAARVDGMDGDLRVDTGSGSIRVSQVRSDDLVLDTGSGQVTADGVSARRIEIDTGSGGIELRSASAPELILDTGSGSIEAELLADVDRVQIDTGSGSVTLAVPAELGATLEVDASSGGIESELPILVREQSRGELRGEIGDGQGRIEIDTGSGRVRLVRARS